MILLVAALLVGSSGSFSKSPLPIDPRNGGYEPIISLPPPTPGPTPPGTTDPSRTKPGAPVGEYKKEIAVGSAGDFPGNIYRVHYNLAVLKWNTGESKWEQVAPEQVVRPQTLNNPIVVGWREPSQSSSVKHGIKGTLTFKNMSGTRVRLELYWVPGGDAWTPPEKEEDSMEFVIP